MVNSQRSTVHGKFLEPQPLFFNWKVQKVGISAVCVVRVASAVDCGPFEILQSTVDSPLF